jgi:Arm DNA-binding domain
MALTDTAIRAAKPKERLYKLADSGGLYLAVSPSGARLWRLKYRLNGREKILSIGAYPAISLALAREKREEAGPVHFCAAFKEANHSRFSGTLCARSLYTLREGGKVLPLGTGQASA